MESSSSVGCFDLPSYSFVILEEIIKKKNNRKADPTVGGLNKYIFLPILRQARPDFNRE